MQNSSQNENTVQTSSIPTDWGTLRHELLPTHPVRIIQFCLSVLKSEEENLASETILDFLPAIPQCLQNANQSEKVKIYSDDTAHSMLMVTKGDPFDPTSCIDNEAREKLKGRWKFGYGRIEQTGENIFWIAKEPKYQNHLVNMEGPGAQANFSQKFTDFIKLVPSSIDSTEVLNYLTPGIPNFLHKVLNAEQNSLQLSFVEKPNEYIVQIVSKGTNYNMQTDTTEEKRELIGDWKLTYKMDDNIAYHTLSYPRS